MKSVGLGLLALLGLVVLFTLYKFVASIPDIARYYRIKKM